MANVKQKNARSKMRPALTEEGRESQMISLAIDLAEKQLRDGTATSQVITHYLKLGSPLERMKREQMEKENELMDAKIEALRSNQRVEELYASALRQFRTYAGQDDEYEDE